MKICRIVHPYIPFRLYEIPQKPISRPRYYTEASLVLAKEHGSHQ